MRFSPSFLHPFVGWKCSPFCEANLPLFMTCNVSVCLFLPKEETTRGLAVFSLLQEQNWFISLFLANANPRLCWADSEVPRCLDWHIFAWDWWGDQRGVSADTNFSLSSCSAESAQYYCELESLKFHDLTCNFPAFPRSVFHFVSTAQLNGGSVKHFQVNSLPFQLLNSPTVRPAHNSSYVTRLFLYYVHHPDIALQRHTFAPICISAYSWENSLTQK